VCQAVVFRVFAEVAVLLVYYPANTRTIVPGTASVAARVFCVFHRCFTRCVANSSLNAQSSSRCPQLLRCCQVTVHPHSWGKQLAGFSGSKILVSANWYLD